MQPSLLPQSSLGKAVRYLLNEYAALTGYLDDGDYLIDNNLVENVIPSSGLRSLCRDARNAEERPRNAIATRREVAKHYGLLGIMAGGRC